MDRNRSPARSLSRFVVAALLCAVAVSGLACATPDPGSSASEAPREKTLEAALRALPGADTPAEATRLARTALAATAALASRYRPLRPPHLGNLAFHLGLRDRALCCHWVEDLLRALSALELQSFDLHWGVAHFGSELREHSAVIAVPTGRPAADGLVLDAWRHSGRLYWVRVDRDRYPWRLHPSNDARNRLACREKSMP